MIKQSRSRTASDGICPSQQIRTYIASKELRAGDRLPTHGELCKVLGVGLRRLREGLSVLRQQGIIETRRRGGTVVGAASLRALEAPISWRLEQDGCTFGDLVRARAAVESAAAAEAAHSRTTKGLLELLDALEEHEKTTDASCQDEQKDKEFHLAVLKATNNPALLAFGKLIVDQFERKEAEYQTVSASKKSRRQHKEIFEAIERQDFDTARAVMYEHVVGQLQDTKR